MKKIYKITAIALALMLLVAGACVQINAATIMESDGFLYSVATSTTSYLHGRTSTDADLVIPKEFSERYVVNIVDSAFQNDQNIESLSFSKAILLERIGFYAFNNCTNLSGQVIFAGRINTIGVSAFEGCSSLESIVFNGYINDISDQCFYKCSSLSSVKLNNRVKTIGKYAFANCTSLEYVEIPSTVTSINSTAFDGDENLVLGVYTDTAGHNYAVEKNMPYILLDGPKSGDANGDGMVDILDSTEIQKFAAEMIELTDEQFELADINDDGFVDVMDALLIQKFVVGKYDIPPIIYNS